MIGRLQRRGGFSRRPTGFSLVELLIVIAIIAVLIGMILPAVQKVRETSNRLKCANNLKQMGLALHNFESNVGWFPPGGVNSPISQAAGILGLVPVPNPSWSGSGDLDRFLTGPDSGIMPFLLPYIEQNALAQGYDLSVPWYDQANCNLATGVIQKNIPIIHCPSAIIQFQYESYFQQNSNSFYYYYNSSIGGTGGYTDKPSSYMNGAVYVQGGPGSVCSDYAPLTGINDTLMRTYESSWPASGSPPTMLQLNAMLRPADVTDGLSTTIAFIEDAGRSSTFYFTAGNSRTGYVSGGGWADSANGVTVDGANYDATYAVPGGYGPCTMNCYNENNIYSFHRNGSNMLFGDGSVSFISQSITWPQLGILMTANHGDVMNFEY